MKQQYLVIIDHDTGVAQLANVAIIKAENEEMAKTIYKQDTGMHYENREMKVIPISDVNSKWYYYM